MCESIQLSWLKASNSEQNCRFRNCIHLGLPTVSFGKKVTYLSRVRARIYGIIGFLLFERLREERSCFFCLLPRSLSTFESLRDSKTSLKRFFFVFWMSKGSCKRANDDSFSSVFLASCSDLGEVIGISMEVDFCFLTAPPFKSWEALLFVSFFYSSSLWLSVIV